MVQGVQRVPGVPCLPLCHQSLVVQMDQGGRLFLGDHRFQRGQGGLVDPGEVETGVEGGQKHRIMDVLDMCVCGCVRACVR